MANKRVLVVDDDPDLRKLVRLGLDLPGLEVHEAENGKVALESLADVKPDLVVLDLMMPEMNGIEFCKEYISGLGVLDVPLLVTSAVSEKSRLVREIFEMEIPVRAFLRKPFATDELIALAAKLLAGESAEAPTPVHGVAVQPAPEPAPSPPPAPSDSAFDWLPDAPLGSDDPTPPPPVRPAPSGGPAMLNQDEMMRIAMEAIERRRREEEEAAEGPEASDAEDTPKPASPAREEVARQRLRILCADADSAALEALRAALSGDHEVELAENGIAALAALDEFEPDFVLAAYEMPQLDGLGTIEAIRHHPKFSETPVFVLAETHPPDLAKRVFDAGGNMLLKKPIAPDRLRKVIDQYVKDFDVRPRARVARRPARAPKDAYVKPRVLVVCDDAEVAARLTKSAESAGRVEVVAADDPRKALGNLGRWEPDGILYNPRNRAMDGMAFVQSLRMKRLDDRYRIAFASTELYDADHEFSRKTFGRDAIVLRAKSAASEIRAFVEELRPVAAPKRYTMEEIRSQDEEALRKSKGGRDRARKEREFYKNRFRGLVEGVEEEE